MDKHFFINETRDYSLQWRSADAMFETKDKPQMIIILWSNPIKWFQIRFTRCMPVRAVRARGLRGLRVDAAVAGLLLHFET